MNSRTFCCCRSGASVLMGISGSLHFKPLDFIEKRLAHLLEILRAMFLPVLAGELGEQRSKRRGLVHEALQRSQSHASQDRQLLARLLRGPFKSLSIFHTPDP